MTLYSKEPEEIKTLEDARLRSIEKWEQALEDANDLESQVGEHCGFCFLSQHHEIFSNIPHICYYCPVETKCNEYKDETEKHLTKYIEWIEGLLEWLKDTDLTKLKSRYQIKGDAQ